MNRSSGPHDEDAGDGRLIRFPQRPGTEAWWTKKRLAEHFNVSPRTIERWMVQGLPHHRVRRTVRYLASEVEAWVRGANA